MLTAIRTSSDSPAVQCESERPIFFCILYKHDRRKLLSLWDGLLSHLVFSSCVILFFFAPSSQYPLRGSYGCFACFKCCRNEIKTRLENMKPQSLLPDSSFIHAACLVSYIAISALFFPFLCACGWGRKGGGRERGKPYIAFNKRNIQTRLFLNGWGFFIFFCCNSP